MPYDRKNRKGSTDEPFNGLSVDFGKTVVIKTIPAIEMKAKRLNVLKVEDDSNAKKVTAYLSGPIGTVVLWEGKAYDEIGQWTDQDVIERLREIYK